MSSKKLDSLSVEDPILEVPENTQPSIIVEERSSSVGQIFNHQPIIVLEEIISGKSSSMKEEISKSTSEQDISIHDEYMEQ